MTQFPEFETNTEVSPVYCLRFYAWEVLRRNMPTVWDTDNYGGLVPIVPLAEEADLAEFSGPKIVYEYTMLDQADIPFRGRGSFSMAVMDTNFRRLTQTLNILQAAFGRLDESARDIDAYIDTTPLANMVGFGYTAVSFVDGGTPASAEGAEQIGVINIRFDYFLDYNIITDVRNP
jgi:hypothetical protein